MRVEGQLILNSLPQRIDAAEAGLGLAYVPDDCVAEALASGRLVRVLAGGPRLPRLPSLLPQPAPAYQRFHAVTGNSATLISLINLSNALGKCFRCVTIRLRVGFSAMSELISYVRMMRKPA